MHGPYHWDDVLSDNHQRPINVAGYGSLLRPLGLDSTLFEGVITARINGMRRAFELCARRVADRHQQKSPRRLPSSTDGTTVLNARPANGEWLNTAILIDLQPELLNGLHEREFCYRLYRVSDNRISVDIPGKTYICSCEERQVLRPESLPIPSYLSVCLQRARYHGRRFYTHFLTSTYVKDRLLSNSATLRKRPGLKQTLPPPLD